MFAYIPPTFHSVSAYYVPSTTTVWERFIDAYYTSVDTQQIKGQEVPLNNPFLVSHYHYKSLPTYLAIVPINAHLARSGVMKQASPLRARLASYWLWVEMSLRIMLVVSITTSSPSWKHWVAAK